MIIVDTAKRVVIQIIGNPKETKYIKERAQINALLIP
jgi:hypothetical protein